MNIKKIFTSALLMLGFLSASAQEAKTVYDFNPHWYVQIQPLGGQYTLGEADFGDLFSYNVQLGAGYQFNSIVGARLSVNAWQSKAGINWLEEAYTWKWKYVAPMVDVTFNLSNLFCGYNPTRIFNFSVFGGLGANIGFDNDEADKAAAWRLSYMGKAGQNYVANQNLTYKWDGTQVLFAARIGANADFRINDMFSVGLEVNANTLSDKYNSKKAGNTDWYFNALAGVKINFGETYTSRRVEAPKPVERIIEKVVERPAVVDPTPVPAATNEVAEVVEPIRRDIFFTIGSVRISNAEQQKIADIADYMKKYPESKVMVTGYADKGTGNANINARLAKQRADVVVKALTSKYGIAASRISSDSKGDTVQPFAENDKNRVTIAIAE